MPYFDGPVIEGINRVHGTLKAKDFKAARDACVQMLRQCVRDWDDSKRFEERFNASTGIKQLLDSQYTLDQVCDLLEVAVVGRAEEFHRSDVSLPIERRDPFIATSTKEAERITQVFEEAAEKMESQSYLRGIMQPSGADRDAVSRLRWHASKIRGLLDWRLDALTPRKRPRGKPRDVLRLLAEAVDDILADQPMKEREQLAACLYIDFFEDGPATPARIEALSCQIHDTILKTARRQKKRRRALNHSRPTI